MRWLTLAALVLLLASPAASGAAEGVTLQFSSPASADGRLGFGAEWALLVFDGAATGVGALDLSASYQEHRQRTVFLDDPTSDDSVPVVADVPPSSARPAEVAGTLRIPEGTTSSLLVVGAIEVASTRGISLLRAQDDEVTCLDSHVGQTRYLEQAARYAEHCLPARVTLQHEAFAAPEEVVLTVRGLKVLESHNVAFHCVQGACPAGNDRDESVGAAGVRTRDLAFHRFESDSGSLELTVSAVALWAGGAALDLDSDGLLRLPYAEGDCNRCTKEAATWTLEGPVALHGVTSQESNRMSGTLVGTPTTLRLDEAAVDPAIVGTAAAVGAAALGAAVLVKSLLVPLFTRLTKEKALDHPRRRRIFEYIQQHPGATFREVARASGAAVGTARHHLVVLGRSGLVSEYQHGGTVRLFENVSRFQQSWADHVLLREPALADLHSWLLARPSSPQKAILEAMLPQGWTRSTTQHRLARLIEGGLVTVRPQGRLKFYSAVETIAMRDAPALAGTSLTAVPSTSQTPAAVPA